MSLPGLVERAAAGDLPLWAVAGEDRRTHMANVASLMRRWAASMELSSEEQLRWASAAYLHDALKDEDPEVLRPIVPPGLADLPGKVLHGPAAAERLRREGIRDEDLLLAVAFHTLGHPGFGRLARALYVADFLEPGRHLRDAWRAELRRRYPSDPDDVTREVAGARITWLVKRRMPIRPETVEFWNVLSRGA